MPPLIIWPTWVVYLLLLSPLSNDLMLHHPFAMAQSVPPVIITSAVVAPPPVISTAPPPVISNAPPPPPVVNPPTTTTTINPKSIPSITSDGIIVPAGAVLPPNPLTPGAPLPTTNPWAPIRNVSVPTTAPGRSTLATVNFVKNDFFIGVAAVFGFIGLIVGGMVVYRWWRGADVDRDAMNARFEKEQKELLNRTNTLKRNMSQRSGRSLHPPSNLMPSATNTTAAAALGNSLSGSPSHPSSHHAGTFAGLFPSLGRHRHQQLTAMNTSQTHPMLDPTFGVAGSNISGGDDGVVSGTSSGGGVMKGESVSAAPPVVVFPPPNRS